MKNPNSYCGPWRLVLATCKSFDPLAMPTFCLYGDLCLREFVCSDKLGVCLGAIALIFELQLKTCRHAERGNIQLMARPLESRRIEEADFHFGFELGVVPYRVEVISQPMPCGAGPDAATRVISCSRPVGVGNKKLHPLQRRVPLLKWFLLLCFQHRRAEELQGVIVDGVEKRVFAGAGLFVDGAPNDDECRALVLQPHRGSDVSKVGNKLLLVVLPIGKDFPNLLDEALGKRLGAAALPIKLPAATRAAGVS